ncbi:glycoside hydrolase family 2 protein [Paenibacillus ehimensis]|uniref:beta-mannosidase n=1 Tax=Paenibacillus ehimensis TaxID=79264 RepID=UPI002DC03956|nr:glycoside hydrolase family 2 protein [Paenibacillus ehimensis]MEC0210680.1 glycoside hydrolase family 2 protein [Paenibacillus ehimensis]
MSEVSFILSQWSFKNSRAEDWMPAQVPGCVHMDLLKNGKIDHPFYGMNESKLQWIDKQDWEYRTTFDFPEELRSAKRVELVFAGLDTYADVWVNDRLVLSADNMFREWKTEVKSLLKERGNVIRVCFRSPVGEDLPKLKRLGYALPATNDQSDVGELGESKVSVFARKAPFHYGWDWGPRFVTSGIWREVRLVGWQGNRILDVFMEQVKVTQAEARLKAHVELEAAMPGVRVVRISSDTQTWEREVMVSAGVNTVEVDLQIDQPKLWWCRGLGEPERYTFQVELIEGDVIQAVKSVQTGLRQVRLVTEPDEKGSTFYIELNGVPVFAKGANHIPNDSFVTEVTYERYKHEIVSAVDSNMNMLRVWGGGIYEEEAFYDLCDEYGLLVWQDFMFACSMYPGDEAFLHNVQAEAEYNIRRLRNHPCIALWCGNNEIDSAWAHYDENGGWGWKKDYTEQQRKQLWADYEAVFHRILPEAVEAFAPGAAYWPSSPLCALTGNIEQHAYPTSTRGDTHYWGVWHAVEPFENYNVKVSRFVSEYGFQSFPEYKSVRTYAEEEDLMLESPVMLAHQKNNRGNQLIQEYMDLYMKQPKDFPSFLYMSQILQAEAIRTAIEAHRRKKPFCMGSLYWQMNDCWPVASWAGMDYYGRWKAMQYHVKRSFKDISLSLYDNGAGNIEVYVISDRLADLFGDLTVKLLTFGGSELKTASLPVSVTANTGRMVFSVAKTEWLADADPTQVVLLAELKTEGLVLDRKEHYFVKDKELTLAKPRIRVQELLGGPEPELWLETDVLARQVWISTETEGRFSDNFFDLIPGVPRKVTFYPRGEAQSGPAKLEIRSMSDFISC